MASLLQLQAKQRGAGHPRPDHEGVDVGLTQQRSSKKEPPQWELQGDGSSDWTTAHGERNLLPQQSM